MTKVRVAVLNQGEVRVELCEQLVIISHDPRYELEITYSALQPIAHNRNHICKAFRASDADYLLMTDSDQFWSGGNPLDMVEHDLDIIGFPTPVYQPDAHIDHPVRWNVYKMAAIGEGASLVEAEAIGSGALLIARRVLEHPDLCAPFMDVWDADGLRVSSEDMWFCKKARDAGFKVWVAVQKPCHHRKVVDLLYLHQLLERKENGGSHSDVGAESGGIAGVSRKLRNALQRLRGHSRDGSGDK